MDDRLSLFAAAALAGLLANANRRNVLSESTVKLAWELAKEMEAQAPDTKAQGDYFRQMASDKKGE